jgi:hypothetical protein
MSTPGVSELDVFCYALYGKEKFLVFHRFKEKSISGLVFLAKPGTRQEKQRAPWWSKGVKASEMNPVGWLPDSTWGFPLAVSPDFEG